MDEIEKIEEQIRKLMAKKALLSSGVPVSKAAQRRAFLAALSAEKLFGMSYARILGIISSEQGVTPEAEAAQEAAGLEILKQFGQPAKPTTAAAPESKQEGEGNFA